MQIFQTRWSGMRKQRADPAAIVVDPLACRIAPVGSSIRPVVAAGLGAR
jgi:hypothetical protein